MENLQISDFLTKEIVGPFIIVIGCIIVYVLLKKLVTKMFAMKLKVGSINYNKQKTLSSVIVNIMKYLIFLIAIIMLLELYGIDTGTIIASLGVTGVVLGLALQDVAKDLIAGITIIFEDQYNVGDVVEIGGFKGEIISLGLRSTVIKKYTGELKIICNRNITEVINFSRIDTFETMNIPVSYNADTAYVEEVLTDLFERISPEFEDLVEPISLLGVNAFDSSAVNYLIGLKTKPTKQYAIKRAILKAIKEEFKIKNIEIPYQQVVIHHEQ